MENREEQNIDTIDSYELIGGQKVSNPGGSYRNKQTGEVYYMKFPVQKHGDIGEDLVRNEVLAAKLYELAGVKVPELSFIKDENGRLGIASKMEGTFQMAQNPEAKSFVEKTQKPRDDVDWENLPGLYEGLAVDAWLANWDVVGLEYDNLGTYTNPDTGRTEAFRLDTGGALVYRAQGGEKGKFFGDEVSEMSTLLGKNPNVKNDQAKFMFGNIPDDKIQEGIDAIARISDEDIENVVMEYGPGNKEARAELSEKMIARKQNLMQFFEQRAQAAEKDRLPKEPVPVEKPNLVKNIINKITFGKVFKEEFRSYKAYKIEQKAYLEELAKLNKSSKTSGPKATSKTKKTGKKMGANLFASLSGIKEKLNLSSRVSEKKGSHSTHRVAGKSGDKTKITR